MILHKIFEGYQQFERIGTRKIYKKIKNINYKKNKFIREKAEEYNTTPLKFYEYILQVHDYNKCSTDDFQKFLKKEHPKYLSTYDIPDIFKVKELENNFNLSFYKKISPKKHIYNILSKNRKLLDKIIEDFDLNQKYFLNFLQNNNFISKTTEEYIHLAREYQKKNRIRKT